MCSFDLFKDYDCLTEVEEIKWRETERNGGALTLSKVTFAFGKISKHVYEARKGEKE